MLGLREVRMPRPSLGPGSTWAGLVEAERQLLLGRALFSLLGGAGVLAVGVSQLCQLQGRLNPSWETAFIVFRCSASPLH